MAHYVFQRNNGFGDFDYIRSFDTMEITDYKEYAAQVDDEGIAFLDIPYLNQLGFFAVRISTLALRIEPLLQFIPAVMGFRPAPKPRPARPRGAAPAPRPHAGPMPLPRPPVQRVRSAVPRPAPAPRRPAPVGRNAAKPAPVGRNAGRLPRLPGDKGPGGRDPRR